VGGLRWRKGLAPGGRENDGVLGWTPGRWKGGRPLRDGCTGRAERCRGCQVASMAERSRDGPRAQGLQSEPSHAQARCIRAQPFEIVKLFAGRSSWRDGLPRAGQRRKTRACSSPDREPRGRDEPPGRAERLDLNGGRACRKLRSGDRPPGDEGQEMGVVKSRGRRQRGTTIEVPRMRPRHAVFVGPRRKMRWEA